MSPHLNVSARPIVQGALWGYSRNPLRCLREGSFKFSWVCACNKWAGINMLMFHVDVTLKQLKIRFKNDSFS